MTTAVRTAGQPRIPAGRRSRRRVTPMRTTRRPARRSPMLLNDEDDEDEEEDEEDDEEEEPQAKGKGKAKSKAADKKKATAQGKDKDEQHLAYVELEKKKKPKQKCDGGKTCVCTKPAAEYPDAPYAITHAGFRKLMNQQIHCQVRDPDSFRMYTYNDHMAYGVLQVLQNLREQWVICEALCPFIWYLNGGDFAMADDGEFVDETAKLIGNLFLATLARLEFEGVLAADSEVEDLGCVMAGMLKTVHKKSKKRPFPFTAEKFDSYVAAYAKKHGITLKGVPGLKALVDDLEGEEEELPNAEEHGEDPWGWADALASYKKGRKIGGDDLDITSWTPAKRKQHAFNKKDPLGKKEIDAIKNGMVMMLG
ncbi:hypothetical protein HER10_EVM0012619 [Colletotrichum scovillei]|uniref:uncharacterized protein n=1 Tax=Colletotrichum scovillei TaxID=1209932 RepID=UPI0015C3F82D|nr:uncharacterized protein HER10_EVM0012619 [Colletotrichum scovillei]KAF4780526.1 hypothetical protein HER10_EVM0012619 [Colletotrichum scovillei]